MPKASKGKRAIKTAIIVRVSALSATGGDHEQVLHETANETPNYVPRTCLANVKEVDIFRDFSPV